MPRIIAKPTILPAAGNMPKEIAEYVGRINTQTEHVSVARMKSPAGWQEPGQRPEFEEITIVLEGSLRVETADGTTFDIQAGQAIVADAGEWIRYSSPQPGGAHYIAICLPAFSVDIVHRDAGDGGINKRN